MKKVIIYSSNQYRSKIELVLQETKQVNKDNKPVTVYCSFSLGVSTLRLALVPPTVLKASEQGVGDLRAPACRIETSKSSINTSM